MRQKDRAAYIVIATFILASLFGRVPVPLAAQEAVPAMPSVENVLSNDEHQRETPAIPGPIFVVTAYYTAIAKGIANGNFNYAYSLFSHRRQARQAYEDFVDKLVDTNRVELEYIELVSQEEQTATVIVVVRGTSPVNSVAGNAAANSIYGVVHYLIKEAGAWRLDQSSVSGTSAESIPTADDGSTNGETSAAGTSTSTIEEEALTAAGASRPTDLTSPTIALARVDPIRARRNLRLREGPGIFCRQIGSLPPNRTVKVLDGPDLVTGFPWFQVEDQKTGRTGWVRGDYLIFEHQ